MNEPDILDMARGVLDRIAVLRKGADIERAEEFPLDKVERLARAVIDVSAALEGLLDDPNCEGCISTARAVLAELKEGGK